MKILMQCDSPLASTGLGRLSRYLVSELTKNSDIEIDLIAVNHFALWFDQKLYPNVRVFAAYTANPQDPQGYKLFQDFILKNKYDYAFVVNDIDILDTVFPAMERARKIHGTKLVAYCPVDWHNLEADRLINFKKLDIPVAYSKFMKDATLKVLPELKDKLKQVNHPLELTEFSVLGTAKRKEVREKVFKLTDENFLITCVARNQWRKNLGQTLKGFKIFHDKYPKARLYLHSKTEDVGGNLAAFATQLGIPSDALILPPQEALEAAGGYSQAQLNNVYNASDVVVSTALGEGWGFTTIEAMICRVPVLAPRNTTFPEILGENEERGYLADCGTTPTMWAFSYGWSNGERPLTDIDSFVSKLEHIYNNKEEAEDKAVLAQKWVQKNCDLKEIGKFWREIFK